MKIEQLIELVNQASRMDTWAQNVVEKGHAAGYSTQEIQQFASIGESMKAILECMATAIHVACIRNHIPSARYALQSMDYAENATRWLYTFLEKTHMDPADFGWRKDTRFLEERIKQYRPRMQAIIDDYERREAFAREVEAKQ